MDNLLSFVLLIYLLVAVAILGRDKFARMVQNYQRRQISATFRQQDNDFGANFPAYSSRNYSRNNSGGSFFRDSDNDGLPDDLDAQPFDAKRY
jgi:hypothetical protein